MDFQDKFKWFCENRVNIFVGYPDYERKQKEFGDEPVWIVNPSENIRKLVFSELSHFFDNFYYYRREFKLGWYSGEFEIGDLKFKVVHE